MPVLESIPDLTTSGCGEAVMLGMPSSTTDRPRDGTSSGLEAVAKYARVTTFRPHKARSSHSHSVGRTYQRASCSVFRLRFYGV